MFLMKSFGNIFKSFINTSELSDDILSGEIQSLNLDKSKASPCSASISMLGVILLFKISTLC